MDVWTVIVAENRWLTQSVWKTEEWLLRKANRRWKISLHSHKKEATSNSSRKYRGREEGLSPRRTRTMASVPNRSHWQPRSGGKGSENTLSISLSCFLLTSCQDCLLARPKQKPETGHSADGLWSSYRHKAQREEGWCISLWGHTEGTMKLTKDKRRVA